MIGRERPLLPEIVGRTDRIGAKTPIFDIFSPVAPQKPHHFCIVNDDDDDDATLSKSLFTRQVHPVANNKNNIKLTNLTKNMQYCIQLDVSLNSLPVTTCGKSH